MTQISDHDLERRLERAGAALDGLATARAASPLTGRRARRRHPRVRYPDLGRPPRLIAAAVAAFALLAIGTAVVLRSNPADERTPSVTVGPATTDPDRGPEEDEIRQVALDELPALGATGLLVATDAGLVSLTAGTATPMLSPADPLGTTAPTAVPDGAGNVFYVTPQVVDSRRGGGTTPTGTPYAWPELRRISDGRDTLVEAGVTSFALRADGAQARAVGTDPAFRGNLRFQTDIVVTTPDGTSTTWSTGSADQQVVAWAGDRLLVEKGIPESEARSLYVMDGPGQQRELSPNGRALAVGPDGQWVVMSGLAPGDGPYHDIPYDGPPPRVVDLASGDVVGPVEMDPPLDGVNPLTWAGDDRLVGSTVVPDTHAPAIVELAIEERSDGTVSLAEVRRIELDPDEIFTPPDVWATATGTIVALATTSDQRYRPRLVVCPPDADDCSLVEPPFGHSGQMAHVVNPSRPLPSG